MSYSSIERVNVHSGNGIVNIVGDNNMPGADQDDYFKVRGGHDPFNPPPANDGVGQFSLQIGGSWTPGTGDVGTPPPSGACRAASGSMALRALTPAAARSAGSTPMATPSLTRADPAGVNALDITPYADNTPQGWGIETYWSQGNQIADGGQPNPDLLIFNGVSGVSENIVVQPSESAAGPTGPAGQVYDNNAATGTPIAVVNYTFNTNIIVNGSSPAGTAGDTDSLMLNGTDPANPGSSGNDTFNADFTRAGTPGQ